MSHAVPQLFERLRTGDPSALGELTPALYSELHRIAVRHLRGERPNHTLQATELVHEAYLKLFDHQERAYTSEVHFLAVASRVMRHVLVDYARGRSTLKRSGGNEPGSTPIASFDLLAAPGSDLVDLIELDNALEALSAEDESLARMIELRFFGGLTAEETADQLGLSVHVVRHDLRFAQAWLRRKLTQS